MNWLGLRRPSPSFDSGQIMREDLENTASPKQRFQSGTKPVIRWVKGDGLDDPITKVAIAQATRLFGSEVDYCLCTNAISAERVRDILSWATEPVEWWSAEPADNPTLQALLANADCLPERYGYWWKWFPERARPHAPEWILDGDMVISAAPPWFKKWLSGKDRLRVSQDDGSPRAKWWLKPIVRKRNRDFKYGEYSHLVDKKLRLYSGLISLPPGLHYMPSVSELLARQPLKRDHDGTKNMSEQGVIAVALQTLGPKPIPLNEFPFAQAGNDFLDFGKSKKGKRVWGYHFSRSFVAPNSLFSKFVNDGTLFSPRQNDHVDKYRWLSGGFGQWGIPGWGMKEQSRTQLLDEAAAFGGKRALDIGTSRGRIAASLADLGYEVTTVDITDRGAAKNLAGLNVKVVVEEIESYLQRSEEVFDLIVVDIHGNTSENWKSLGSHVLSKLDKNGKLIINNVRLYKIFGWENETGVSEFIDGLSREWKIKIYDNPLPGLAVLSKRRFHW